MHRYFDDQIKASIYAARSVRCGAGRYAAAEENWGVASTTPRPKLLRQQRFEAVTRRSGGTCNLQHAFGLCFVSYVLSVLVLVSFR
jgi:hypothetical protein